MPTPSVDLRDKLLLDLEETAAYVGLAESTIRQLVDDDVNPLPAFRHGRRWCVVRRELDGWAQAQLNHYRGETTPS